jgi:hypothetical protein
MAEINTLEMLYNYTNSEVLKDNNIDEEETDQIIKLIGRDGVVDEDEYNYVAELMDTVIAVYIKEGVDMMSDELMEKLIEYVHVNYVDYAEETLEKYPALERLGNSLPVDLRETIDYVVLSNAMNQAFLKEDDWQDYSRAIRVENAVVAEWLKELAEILPSSPYKTELTIIYEAELKLLQENQRKVQ